jgi:hypothetical protein
MRLVAVLGLTAGLAGCVVAPYGYAPAPAYGYYAAPAYGYYAPPAYYAPPTVSFGFGFGGRGHWHGR